MSTDGPACIARTDPAMAGITGSGTATAGLPPHAAASCLASHAAFATSSDTNGAAGAAAIRTAGEGTGTDATGAAVNLIAGFLGLLLLDWHFWQMGLAPKWWMHLRGLLTALVVLSFLPLVL